MPAEDNPENQEQTDEAPGTAREYDTDRVLATLSQVFSTFKAQLQEQAPRAFEEESAARVAVDTFNDIVADLRFTPCPFRVAGRSISPTEAELTWTDDTVNADGYRVKRCQGRSCENLVAIAQLSPSERSFRDGNLAPNTAYRYQLVAFNPRGERPSNIVDITTTANPLST